MRKILHSFADENCLKILTNIKAGLTEQSVILIDETVLPEEGARPRGAQHDIEVLMSVGMYSPFLLILAVSWLYPALCNSTGCPCVEEMMFTQHRMPIGPGR